MDIQDLKKLDESFDWQNVYKQNYCSLYNIKVFKMDVKLEAVIDGKQLEYKGLYVVVYREWMNNNWFRVPSLQFGNTPMFWISKQRAKDWLKENIVSMGYDQLSQDEAIQTANIYLNCK